MALTAALGAALALLAGAAAIRPGRAAARLEALAPGRRAGPAPAAALTARWGELPVLRQRRLRQRDAQLPSWLERVASALRAGAAPSTAIRETAVATPAPLGPEVAAVTASTDHGVPLAHALDAWRRRPGASAGVELAATALALGLATGGQVARAVDQVAATLRDRLEAQGEVRALATQARTSAWVLATAPAGFTALTATVEPRVLSVLLGTPLGLLCLVAGLGLEGAGAAWMARIVRRAAA